MPLSEIAEMPGAQELSAEQAQWVVHTPLNLQWLSRPAYWVKRGRSSTVLVDADPTWLGQQVELEHRVRAEMARIVAGLAAGEHGLLAELQGAVPTTVSGLPKLEEVLGDGRGPLAMFPIVESVAGPLAAIGTATDAADRVAAALSRWNPDFCDLVPGFAEALRTRLVDARLCYWLDEGPGVLYFVANADDELTVWIGWDPRTLGDRVPPFWDTIPAAARQFLTTVHPGFTMLDGESFGLAQPSYMSTFAEWALLPGGIPDWPADELLDSRRALWLTYNGSDTVVCTSPDLPDGMVAVFSEDGMDVDDFGSRLDRLMLSALRL